MEVPTALTSRPSGWGAVTTSVSVGGATATATAHGNLRGAMSVPLTSCPQCGARLDAAPRAAAYVHTCHYCSAPIVIDPLPQAPVQVAPARIEIAMPAATAAAAAQAATTTARGLAWIIGVSVVLPVVIPLLIFLAPSAKALVQGRFTHFPMTVGLNESLELDGLTSSRTDTLVTVGVNGKLTLRRCHLKGGVVVKAGVNAEITVIDSALEGTTSVVEADGPNVTLTVQNSTLTSAEEIVEAGSTNLKVVVSHDSKLRADGVALPSDNLGEVSIDHSSVEGKLGGIAIKNNGKVKLSSGAVVKSDAVGVELNLNGHLTVTSSRVESRGTAVRGGTNLDATLRSATLVGPRASMDVGTNAHVTAAQSTFNGPKLVPRGSQLEER